MKLLVSLSLGGRLKHLGAQLFSEVTIVYNEMALPLNPCYFLLLNLIKKMGPMAITQATEYLFVNHPPLVNSQKMLKEGDLTKHSHPIDKPTNQLTLNK